MPVPEVVAELDGWLGDDRQWYSASSRNWKSLIGDLQDALFAYPDSVLDSIGDPVSLRAEVRACLGAQGDQAIRAEAGLRRRLTVLCEDVAAGLRSSGALEAAWADLGHRSGDPELARAAASRLLDLATWVGHGRDRLAQGLVLSLRGDEGQSAERRLEQAAEHLSPGRLRRDLVVWRRLVFARVDDPPVIELGPDVCIYGNRYLRDLLASPADGDAPPEAIDGGAELRRFCENRHDETPMAMLRVQLRGATLDEAIRQAQLTASTLGAFGALHGTAPSLWQVDPSYLTFEDGALGYSLYTAPLVEGPTLTERIGIEHDRTAAILAHYRDHLASHLPIRDGAVAQTAELLRWLRDSRARASPSRLVLCDRTIERVSAWAGIASPRRFVDQHLVPSWAYARMRTAISNVAVSILYSDERLFHPPGSPGHSSWEEIASHPDLELEKPDGGYRFNAKGLVRHTDWLMDRLPDESTAYQRLSSIARELTSAEHAARWFAQLCDDGRVFEGRRSRARNAVMHGGPLADSTVEAVLPFAEYMASEAVDGALAANLAGEDVVDYFIQRARRLAEMQRKLREGVPPYTALFWE